MIWENGIETCITSYKKLIASPGSMQDTGCLGLVHWDDPEGWWGGVCVGKDLIFTYGQFNVDKISPHWILPKTIPGNGVPESGVT